MCRLTKGNSRGNFFNGSFGEGCDIVVQETWLPLLTAIRRSHDTVQNTGGLLEPNVKEDIITRHSQMQGATVNVWPHATGEQITNNGRYLGDLAG